MVLISKPLAAALLISLKSEILLPERAATIKLCIGEIPTDAEIETITQTSARITDNVAVTISNTGLTSTARDANWPLCYYTKTLPSPPGALSTKVGRISWCVLQQTDNNAVVVADVSLTNGTGLVQVDKLDVIVGTSVALTNIAIQMKRWDSET